MGLDPFVQHNPIVSALQQQRGRREQTRENGARLCKVYSRWTTTGRGFSIVPDAFDFNCTFLEEPSFQTGFALAQNDPKAPDLDETDLPAITAGVYKWRQDAIGHYTGAWVFFTMTSIAIEYVINHYMSWEGLAMKDLPVHLLDD